MIDETRTPDYSGERPELSFEEGVEETLRRIYELLKLGQNYVVVAVSGFTQVGKTKFSSSVFEKLTRSNVPVISCANVQNIESRMDNLKFAQENSGSEQGVIILDATTMPFYAPRDLVEEVRAIHDKDVHDASQKLGLSVEKIDVRVAIYRPDDLETRKYIGLGIREDIESLADIIIKNDQARDRIAT